MIPMIPILFDPFRKATIPRKIATTPTRLKGFSYEIFCINAEYRATSAVTILKVPNIIAELRMGLVYHKITKSHLVPVSASGALYYSYMDGSSMIFVLVFTFLIGVGFGFYLCTVF